MSAAAAIIRCRAESMFRIVVFTILSLCCCGCNTPRYPREWWTQVPREQAEEWEILPQDAGPGEVILSKRGELGLLSNFAATPFVLDGNRFASLEGFWQMMKYPESPDDPRNTGDHDWPHTREQVAQMVSFVAKKAGSDASRTMDDLGINWVTYQGRRMTYRTPEKGEHYQLIVRATRAKVNQNPRVKNLLLRTGDLILCPDHKQGPDPPPAWQYHRIYMDIRDELLSPAHHPVRSKNAAGNPGNT